MRVIANLQKNYGNFSAFVENPEIGKSRKPTWIVVAKGGIEPPTQGFSVLCSTD
jgi:hypothetical protein